MYSLNYHAYDDTENKSLNKCNRHCEDYPLLVNCTGNISTTAYFNTDNPGGRVDYYLMYITSGKLNIAMPNGWRECTAGDFFFFPPNTRYRFIHSESSAIEYFWVHFTGSAPEKTLRDYGLGMYPSVNSIKDDGSIRIRFRNMFDAFSKQDKFRDIERSRLLNRLLISLARRVAGGENANNQLRTSISYINSAYNTEIRVPELAKIENLSVSRYNTLFRKIMGVSPLEYITKMRIASACELLTVTDLSVKEIGALVGYNDPHFFSRIFKTNLGVSPIEYRKYI